MPVAGRAPVRVADAGGVTGAARTSGAVSGTPAVAVTTGAVGAGNAGAAVAVVLDGGVVVVEDGTVDVPGATVVGGSVLIASGGGVVGVLGGTLDGATTVVELVATMLVDVEARHSGLFGP